MPPLIPLLITIAVTIAVKLAMQAAFPPPSARRTAAQQLQAPTAAEGKINTRQAVPSLSVVLGTVKKAYDYDLIAEREGIACRVMVWAGHRISGFVQHYLHDEAVTVVAGSVTEPAHFVYAGTPYVGIVERLGLDVQTSVGLESFLPEKWSADHRGDGLAYIRIDCVSISQDKHGGVYPQGLPEPSAVGDGALVFDPREAIPEGTHDPADRSTWEFSRNLALLRMHHETHPWGGKFNLADMYLPDWTNAADVSDEEVLNRNGDPEPRYHGGYTFKEENDQVEVGKTLDEAGELVIYKRPDGKIGVHSGEMVTPDIRLVAADFKEFEYDPNLRTASTVLAVRGRFTDPENDYNTVDAAIWGDPYTGEDTQRTKPVDNAAVQSHNHIQRLQKLAFIRANAPRIKGTIRYDPTSTSRHLPRRRFVRVHMPGRGLDEAVIEIMGRTRLSLADLTISFEGIVVPSTLYAFNAATEEGVPSGSVESVVPGGVPEPEDFAIAIGSEALSGGQSTAFALASWDYLSDALTAELEYQLDDESEPPRTTMSRPGATELRTEALQDGALYRFRLRYWSNNVTSDWTGYETATATADPSAPGLPTDFASSEAGGDVTLDWINPNSPNLYKTELYRGGSAVFGSAVLIQTFYGGIAESRSYEDVSLASGTYYWWVRSFNASGVASAEVGPVSETV